MLRFPRCGVAHSFSLSSAGLTSHARASPLATAHASVPASFHHPHPAVSLGTQIPQNGIPHSNFLSHSKVEPLAPNTNIKSTTGYGPSPHPKRRVVFGVAGRPRGRVTRGRPPHRRLAARVRVSHFRPGAAAPAPRRCTSRARSTSTCRRIEQGELCTAPLAHRAVVRTSRSCARSASAVDVDVKANVDVRSLIICTWFRGAHRRHGQ